jgi:hypothetical protein
MAGLRDELRSIERQKALWILQKAGRPLNCIEIGRERGISIWDGNVAMKKQRDMLNKLVAEGRVRQTRRLKARLFEWEAV